jgi:hypothetical protein
MPTLSLDILTPRLHLTAARALVAEPECLTKGCAGRDALGRIDFSKDFSRAVSFCMAGALWRVQGSDSNSHAERLLHEIVRTTTRFNNIVSFNDHPSTTHAQALAVFDAAIAAAEREEAL